MKMNDALSGAALMALALAMLVVAAGFPGFPGQSYGPSLFPSILGVGLLGAGALLTLRGLRAGGPWLTLDPALVGGRGALSFALVVAAVLAMVLFGQTVGFLPVCVLSLTVLMLQLGVGPLRALALALAVTVAIQGFFGHLLRVPLPPGWLA